jgi:hypothetical protein
MSTSVVNGYLCTNCGDVDKAKRGVDPHPPLGTDGDAKGKHKTGTANADQPAVIFGGVLSAAKATATGAAQATATGAALVTATGDAQATESASSRPQGFAVDLLA